MRLRADQPEARNVCRVLLDGKPVPLVIEVDDEEGWVKSQIPELPEYAASNGDEVINDEAHLVSFTVVKRYGEVKIEFYESNSSVDH